MEDIGKLGSLDFLEGIGKHVGCGVLGCIIGIYLGELIKDVTDMGRNEEKFGMHNNPMKYPNMGGVECIDGGVGCTCDGMGS